MGKVVPLAEAAALVRDGDDVALCGFATARNAVAFAHELIRQRRRELTLSGAVFGFESDLLVGAGCARRIIYGGGSLDRYGPLLRVSDAIERRRIAVEYGSSLSVVFRYLAGALGLPSMPIKSLLGSDLLRGLERDAPDVVRLVDDPFTGERLVLLKALVPDVAVVHVQRADDEGNAQILGPRWDNLEATRAAETTIVLAEEIVTSETIRAQPELTVVPGFRVSAVVRARYGAHPTSVYRHYDYDADHLRLYVERSRTQTAFDEYLREYVLDRDLAGYLERVGGGARLQELAS